MNGIPAGVQRFAVALLILPLIACGRGATSSGAAADDSTGDLAGVYHGSESLMLVRSADGNAIDAQHNIVNITIAADGIVSLSSSSGTGGQAQIINDGTFRMRADARTHFDGGCSGGTLFLDGHMTAEGNIAGRYRSMELHCDGVAHDLTGELRATRGQAEM